MKKVLYVLLAISTTFVAQFANAQNCPSNPTYSNQSGTFELSANRSIVLNNGKTFQITVQNSFSSTSSICVTGGSTLNLSFLNVNTIQAGGSIYVEKNATLSITGNINKFPLTLTNAGTVSQYASVTFADGVVITNSGTYNMTAASTISDGTESFSNSGTFNIKNALTTNGAKFTFTNTSSGTVTFSNTLTLNNTTLANAGTINFNALQLQNSCAVTNNGYMYMTNTGSNSFFLSSSSTVTNNGVISISGSTLINSGNTLTNTCTLKNALDFNTDGSVNNSGSLLLTVSASSKLKNQGTFTNGTAGFVQGTSFENNATVRGSGNFYFSGDTKNQGTFTGGDSKINFYDASNSTANYFDNQISAPVNTTKNQISPNTATTFSSCADVSAPVITIQPLTQSICSLSTTEAKFSVTATSNTTPTYQWYKNEKPVTGATSNVFSISNLTLADTVSFYNVVVTNTIGSVWSSSAYVKYIILAQPSPASQLIATGNKISFSGIKTSGATSLQWQKDGVSISGATSVNYTKDIVNYADSGKYTVLVSYSGGTCTSDAAVLKTAIVLYSKATGDINQPATWGVNTDGSGSTPVDFTRSEHTFVVANRPAASTATDLTIAGTLDIANSKTTIAPNTTLQANRIIRSLSAGSISVSPASSLIVGYGSASADQSELYFDATANTIKNLTINAKNVVLHSVLNIESGKNYGLLQVAYGTFNTSGLLTLKSDSLGTAGIAKSAGTITGKVTIERFMHARRAWRFIGVPVSGQDAPTINAAWQEGAAGSTANPAPGFGTHITGGAEADGFDRSPSNHSSLKYLSNTGAWTPVPNTNKTSITQYPAYMIFVRGNRSYDITTTTEKVTPSTTVLRVTGNIYQGTMAAKTVSAQGYTMVMNPYASPVNFAKIIAASKNVKARIRVWDPTLAGNNGVGGWIVIDGSAGTYRATPPSTYVTSVLQAGQGFIVESADGNNNGALAINEDAKDFSSSTISADRITGSATDTSLEVNLKLFNDDGSASITDGVLFNFGSRNNDSADAADAFKMYNTGENLEIMNGSSRYAIDSRKAPKNGDSLNMNIYGVKAASYQLEFVPSLLANKTFALYDSYLKTVSPISATDTTRITFSVVSGSAASKAVNRFTIVTQTSKVIASLPAQAAPALTFIKVRTYNGNSSTISTEFTVQNESSVLYYQVQKSADGSSFTAAGSVVASAKGTYTYTDVAPAAGINYYRIRSVARDGSITYSPVVTGQLAAAAPAASVYPNPLTSATFTLTLSSLPAGSYSLNITSAAGDIVYSRSITHTGGTASQKIILTNKLSAGIYYLHIASAAKTVSTVKVVAN